MTITDLMDRADAAGIRLWLDDGHLRYQAPATNEGRDLLAWLGANRDGVIERLRTHAFVDAASRLLDGWDTWLAANWPAGRAEPILAAHAAAHTAIERDDLMGLEQALTAMRAEARTLLADEEDAT